MDKQPCAACKHYATTFPEVKLDPCDHCCPDINCRWELNPDVANLANPDPVIVAAKNLLAFLDDKGECEICTQGGRGDEGGVFFELGRYDRVALPDRELEKLQNALQDAINEMEGSDTK